MSFKKTESMMKGYTMNTQINDHQSDMTSWWLCHLSYDVQIYVDKVMGIQFISYCHSYLQLVTMIKTSTNNPRHK